MTPKQYEILMALLDVDEEHPLGWRWVRRRKTVRELYLLFRRAYLLGNWMAFTGWDKQGLHVALEGMERRGWVVRRQSPQGTRWAITDEGFEAWEAAPEGGSGGPSKPTPYTGQRTPMAIIRMGEEKQKRGQR